MTPIQLASLVALPFLIASCASRAERHETLRITVEANQFLQAENRALHEHLKDLRSDIDGIEDVETRTRFRDVHRRLIDSGWNAYRLGVRFCAITAMQGIRRHPDGETMRLVREGHVHFRDRQGEFEEAVAQFETLLASKLDGPAPHVPSPEAAP